MASDRVHDSFDASPVPIITESQLNAAIQRSKDALLEEIDNRMDIRLKLQQDSMTNHIMNYLDMKHKHLLETLQQSPKTDEVRKSVYSNSVTK